MDQLNNEGINTFNKQKLIKLRTQPPPTGDVEHKTRCFDAFGARLEIRGKLCAACKRASVECCIFQIIFTFMSNISMQVTGDQCSEGPIHLLKP